MGVGLSLGLRDVFGVKASAKESSQESNTKYDVPRKGKRDYVSKDENKAKQSKKKEKKIN